MLPANNTDLAMLQPLSKINHLFIHVGKEFLKLCFYKTLFVRSRFEPDHSQQHGFVSLKSSCSSWSSLSISGIILSLLCSSFSSNIIVGITICIDVVSCLMFSSFDQDNVMA